MERLSRLGAEVTNRRQYSLLWRMPKDSEREFILGDVIISTDKQAIDKIGNCDDMLMFYLSSREDGLSVQESITKADERWYREIAKPELEGILDQLRNRLGGKDE